MDRTSSDVAGVDLVRFAEVFDRDDAKISSVVRRAVEDPAGYVDARRSTLRLRGIRAPVPRLAWLALVDALVASSFAVELDWRDSTSTALEQLFALRIVPTGERVSEVPGPDFELDERWVLTEAIRRAAATLAMLGIDVLVVDIQTDSLPVFCARSSATPELETLALRAGAEIRHGCRLVDGR
jgi:hypothetical protein